jgi:hypothetical protein
MIAEGFVMAMKGDVTLRRDKPAGFRFLPGALFLVSRVGPKGGWLLVSWAGRDADAASLRTRLTLVGQQSVSRPDGTACFRLLSETPAGISVAGRTVPTTGRALLSNIHSTYTLWTLANLPNGLSCRIAIRQFPWIGEIIDDSR